MTRFGQFFFHALAISLVNTPAMAFSQKDNLECSQPSSPDQQVAACTRALNAGGLTAIGHTIFLSNRGNAWLDKHLPDRAISDFDEALRFTPKHAFALNGRGNAWRVKGDYDRAIADLTLCISLIPKAAIPYNGRGAAFFDKGDYETAIKDFDQAIRLDPKYADAFNGRANAWRNKGEFDRAISDYTESIRLRPTHPFGYNGRASTWAEKGDTERAIADYTVGIALDPTAEIPFNNRALLWRNIGEYDKAIADDNEAIRLNPKFDTAVSNRGEIWRLKGDLTKALADQDEAIRLNPKNGTNLVLRGDTYRYMGDLKRALADYDAAVAMSPDDISAYTGRGLTFEKLDDLTRARVEFQNALSTKSQKRFDKDAAALETARAHLAALASGAPLPVIPNAPTKALSSISIPTTNAVLPHAIQPQPKQGRRVALVIGNSSYKTVPALPNPEKDAEAIAASLRNVGFDAVTLATDLTREKLVDALRLFANAVEEADWAMVYYAGHGMEVGGVNYLIPVDAKIAVDRDIQFEAVTLDQVLATVEGAKKIKIVMLDACRDNPFNPRRTAAPDAVAATALTAGAPIASRSIRRGLGEVKVTGATLVVYAAKNGQVALDGDGGNSPFAIAVIQRVATPGVEINKLFRLVRDDVMEATAGRQEPYTYGSLPGKEDFFFVAK
jgi:tetratricopeptide (TPR) repeat protein